MAEKVIEGRVLKFGDSVNTDVISPARWMRQGLDVLRLHTMEAIRPDFYKDAHPGDIIVGGKNFGCGSHREPATTIMKTLGIAAIVADSVARLYYRSCIAFGIPVLGIEGVARLFEEGDRIRITMSKHDITIKNITRGDEMKAPPMPGTMTQILEAGGVYPLLRQKIANEK
jgi:3-isopropylmalate/(R)-2-methylmalate dehydratase small subunit